MEVKEVGFLDLRNGAERNFYRVSKEFADSLLAKGLRLYVDSDAQAAFIFDGDDCIGNMTLNQLASRKRV